MRSFRLTLAAAAALWALSPVLATAGQYAHAARDMVVRAVNPIPPEGGQDFVEYGGTCKVPLGKPITRFLDDDLRVLVFTEGKPGKPPEGECPLGTVFYLPKDDFARMEYEFLLAGRSRIEAELSALADEAKKKYQAMGLTDEKLHIAVLLDPKSLEKRAILELARFMVYQERESMDAEKKIERKLAATN